MLPRRHIGTSAAQASADAAPSAPAPPIASASDGGTGASAGTAPDRTYLAELFIRDFALVAEQRVSLTPGLNVVTGESGSGKVSRQRRTTSLHLLRLAASPTCCLPPTLLIWMLLHPPARPSYPTPLMRRACWLRPCSRSWAPPPARTASARPPRQRCWKAGWRLRQQVGRCCCSHARCDNVTSPGSSQGYRIQPGYKEFAIDPSLAPHGPRRRRPAGCAAVHPGRPSPGYRPQRWRAANAAAGDCEGRGRRAQVGGRARLGRLGLEREPAREGHKARCWRL